jgi:hypothetical protein
MQKEGKRRDEKSISTCEGVEDGSADAINRQAKREANRRRERQGTFGQVKNEEMKT